ncbi:MAG: CvpA family protein [Acutalibacteraceae bacterium]|nr:CvpA family protein [Acutalibacteraceae bacterium]
MQSVEPVYIKIISACATMILFFVLSVIVGVLCHLSGIVNKIPIVGGANKIIGGIIGLVYGGILVVIAVFIMSFVIPFFDQDNSFKENVQNNSIFFKLTENSGATNYEKLFITPESTEESSEISEIVE